MTQKETENEIHNIGTFIHSGIFVLSVILIASLAIAYGQNHIAGNSISTSSNSVGGKELPIYCVDTKEPKIALSFDAAWGGSH